MDDTDRKLLILMGGNPRIHFQELARMLGISKQAVHHRVKALTDSGVIKGVKASISVSYLDAIPVAISGRSRTTSVMKTLDRLGENDLTRRVCVAGGNVVYVVGLLREICELDGFVEFVKRAAEMSEPTVGIFCLDDGLMPYYPVDGSGGTKRTHRPLSHLDLKIIAALKDDARRPVAEISHMTGASAKTVRRHLDNMISDGSLELQMPSDLSCAGDFFLVTELCLRDGADKVETGRRLLSKSPFQDQYIRTHSNLPNLLIWVFWSGDMAEIRRVLMEVSEDDDILSVVPNFVYIERMYPTWREKLPEIQNHLTRKARGHKMKRGLG